MYMHALPFIARCPIAAVNNGQSMPPSQPKNASIPNNNNPCAVNAFYVRRFDPASIPSFAKNAS